MQHLHPPQLWIVFAPLSVVNVTEVSMNKHSTSEHKPSLPGSSKGKQSSESLRDNNAATGIAIAVVRLGTRGVTLQTPPRESSLSGWSRWLQRGRT